MIFSTRAFTRRPRRLMSGAGVQDYIRTPQAKGLSARRILIRHGLRNALIPVVTVQGIALLAARVFMVVNLMIDLLYVALNPRIRL